MTNDHVNDGEEARRCPTCESLHHRECEPEASDPPGTTDIEVFHEGSIFLFTPKTLRAAEWLEEHIDPEATRFGAGVVVEPRYVADLTLGLLDAGLIVR